MPASYLLAISASLLSAAPISADERVDYVKHVKPLLETKCYSCHGVLKQESDLRLDTGQLILRGGDSGPAIKPNHSINSLLIERITAADDSRMPPPEDGASLKPDEIAILRKWIDQGAIAPDEKPMESPQKHWAFARIERPPLQVPEGTNPIDVLLEEQRQAAGIRVQPKASRSLLIRRLYLDLIGLPPTLEQQRDSKPYEQIVDELLASPQHGERWARHWMDVWRYSDWYGLNAQLRYSQKHMWHWRDWIVNSLNADKPYGRMVEEMLAGDELAPGNMDAVAGTGFLARNYYLFNRTTWLDSTIEHTGKAFLGLTLNCAKCHDHKYDPITHDDYYSMRAIFEPHQVRLDPVPGETNFEKDGLPRVFDDQPEAKTYLHLRGDPKNPDKSRAMPPRVPALFASFQPKIEPIRLPMHAYAPGTRDQAQAEFLKQARAQLVNAQKMLESVREADAASAKQATAGTLHSVFRDDFDKENTKTWEVTGPWKYEDGVVRRTTTTRESESLRLRRPLPQDFELSCRYTHTGGATYKSVTLRFDESADRQYANFVYTSAHAPGPKVQVAYTRNGQSVYPAAGRVSKRIKIGEPMELRFAVRHRLVNVWLNGKFVVAVLLPDRRPGSLSLSGFDATVDFDWIELRSLPVDVKLTAPKNSPAGTMATPKFAMKLAELRLTQAQANLMAVEAVIAADKAKAAAAADVQQLAKKAARLQAQHDLARAKHDELAAYADTKKINAAKSLRKSANERLAKLKTATGVADYKTFRASRKALEGPDHKEANYPATYSAISTGRRLALARWVTSRDNPLTARVAVNHVWMRHFGEPLVQSVSDFGLRAKKPIQARLLDWLAAEFIESGWNFKHLHRLMVTSKAYQLSSSPEGATETALAQDASNTLYWRANSKRMQAQVVRDSLLKLSGTLDDKLGGPPVDPNKASQRRSLYFRHSRDQRDKFLSMFDDADLLQCYRRSESVVPQQALAMANSRTSMNLARQIAASVKLSLVSRDERSFIETAFETVLSRSASEKEIEACRDFCRKLRPLLLATNAEDVEDRTRTRLVHSLLNHNDFIVIR